MSYLSVFSGRKREWSPGKDTTNSSQKRNAWTVAYFRVAGRKVAMRKHEKGTILRVFAWRLFAFSPRKHAYTTWHKSATMEMCHAQWKQRQTQSGKCILDLEYFMVHDFDCGRLQWRGTK